MKKIKIWLPIYASAEFECEVDEKLLDNKDALIDEVICAAKRTGYLCHHCSRTLETGYTIADDVYNSKAEIDYLYEEIKEQINEE